MNELKEKQLAGGRTEIIISLSKLLIIFFLETVSAYSDESCSGGLGDTWLSGENMSVAFFLPL